MLKEFFYSFLYTVFIVFGSVLLGFFSNIAQLTEWNIIDVISENKPVSYIILILVFIVIYLITLVVRLFKNDVDGNNSKKGGDPKAYHQKEVLDDGVMWEWDGVNTHTLIPLCPRCQNELEWIKEYASFDKSTDEKLYLTIGDSTVLICTRDKFKKNYGELSQKEVIKSALKELQRIQRIKL